MVTAAPACRSCRWSGTAAGWRWPLRYQPEKGQLDVAGTQHGTRQRVLEAGRGW
ncbi:hypothetical protein I553_4052 [Mycobacterium xenopi 4042]|uniref:Uncharacterized protein n=1 Tax=Mycobacterium xenopi 4042 TaxID=1299334 RepID=X7Z1M2_MYCXE|nr:hypothetical protein I553_4052 [Mycobacterium xenopi 4042]